MNPLKFDSIYRRLPYFLQDIAISAKGASHRWGRVDEGVARQRYKELLASQYWSKQEIEKYQIRELRNLLNMAFTTVPYYIELKKKHGLDAEAIQKLSDLEAIPTLPKAALRGSESQFLNQRISRGIHRSSTSGTTGTPICLFSTRYFFALRWAFELRLRDWAGLENVVRPRRAQFTGRDICSPTDLSRFWRFNWSENTLLLSSSNISSYSAPAYAEALRHFRPDFIDGYSSAISLLARICMRASIKLPRVRAIRVSAETLTPEDRLVMQDAFDTKVFDQYDSSESACFCSDNPHQEMVVHPEFGILEVLGSDDKPVQPGKTGRVVTTAFTNRLMPLIRYELGDCVTVSPEEPSCKAGAAFQRLSRIDGRQDDILEIPGVGSVGRLDPVFKGLKGLDEAQIVMHSSILIELKLVRNSSWNDKQEDKLIVNLRKKVGRDIQIKVSYLGQIPRGANGKFRSVINLCAKADKKEL